MTEQKKTNASPDSLTEAGKDAKVELTEQQLDNTSGGVLIALLKSGDALKVPGAANTTINPGQAAARSYHPGGVNVLLADGSVRFVRNTIDAATWRALGTRAGGEVFGNY